MHSQALPPALPVRLGVGIASGVTIAAVDSLACQGEVSPIVIVFLLLGATAALGAIWGRRSWVSAVATWVCLPSAHLLMRLLGLPDTLHPNTWASLLLLAAFTFAVAAFGTAGGLVVHRLVRGSQGPSEPRA
jgi:hypothetical protein